MVDSQIHTIWSREILDSRGNPTVETTVILHSGYRGTVSVPSGASVGQYEAVELRDNDPLRMNGKGVLLAVNNVNTIIAKALKDKDAYQQKEIDAELIALDGTPNKSKLGANAILSVSLAVAVAASQSKKVPVYQYINSLIQQYVPIQIKRLPSPLFNIINGKSHGVPTIDFQEFFVIPASNYQFHDALRIGVEVYHSLKNILKERGIWSGVGDEGGFAPAGFQNSTALSIVKEAIERAKFRIGTDVFMGIDAAASVFYTNTGYALYDPVQQQQKTKKYSKHDLIDYYASIHKDTPLLMIEDGLSDDDFAGWTELAERFGNEIYIVGDDFIVTSAKRLEDAIVHKCLNAVIIKPNQIGTLTEVFDLVKIAKTYGVKCIVAHRSGETTDTFAADLSVGIQAEYVKFGAPARGERVVKYNRLLEIEGELTIKK
jgi:enolase